MFVVRLEAMKFHARIGVLPHEAEIAQPLEVDVSAWVEREQNARGSEGVLDYRHIYGIVSSIVAADHILYLEDLVAAVADQMLKIDGVHKVVVNARKPQVSMPGPLAYAQVTLDRARNG
ncbi:MAG TPA: dihydroneopterin aldolase [Gemmatimonadaceae bacterium]|nr:dihydroneopterin aldolase [Gemmatimonadaceae bacterium]